jgi:E3 ubiquitin-protein ligase RAD18
MVDCPVCSHSFTLVALHQHLDKGCNPGDPEPSPKDRGLPTVKGVATTGGGSSWFQRPSNTSSSKNDGSTTGGSPAPRKKLARPNYSFVKDPEIRKLLEEFKLATSGSKERLVDRHRHWVSLYNANLDANEKLQKNDVQLRKEMAVWERGQEEGLKRSKSKMASMTEEKAIAWQESNEAQFRDLEKKARETHFKNKAAHQQIRTQQEESHEEAVTGVLSGNST